MYNKLYFKLAITNLKKNSKMIIPFSISVILAVFMFYNGISLSKTDTEISKSLGQLLSLISSYIAVFSGFLLFYTNSFLTNRRKKEFGLYNILGLEKRHINIVIFVENAIIGIFSIILGIILGIILNRLLIFMLYNIVNFDLVYTFHISLEAILITVYVFLFIFLLLSVSNTISVYRYKAIDLINADKKGEKRQKSNLLLVVIGIIALGYGYYLALSTENIMYSLQNFFIAVLAVSLGTYCFFSAITSSTLNLMKKNKNYYYKAENFISISGLVFRIKKNAVGLTIITILSTGIIIAIATTTSLYLSIGEIFESRYPRDVDMTITATYAINQDMIEIIKQEYPDLEEPILYDFFYWYVNDQKDVISMEVRNYSFEYTQEVTQDYVPINFISTESYYQATGKEIEIKENSYISTNGYNDKFDFYGMNLQYQDSNNELLKSVTGVNFALGETIILNTADYDKLIEVSETEVIISSLLFNLDNHLEAENELITLVGENIDGIHENYISIKPNSNREFYSMYGTLFFSAFMITSIFVIGILLILYYKQVIEGYQDRDNFTILKKIGMSDKLAKKSINKQVIMVFLLPIIAGTIHIIFSYKIITLILKLLSLTNEALFLVTTIITTIIFFIIYLIMYLITSKVYKKIVSQ